MGALPARLMRVAALTLVTGLMPMGCAPGPDTAVRSGGGSGATSRLVPDSVRVGEPMTLGIVVRRDEPGEVRFPTELELPDRLEQRGPVEVVPSGDRREWRAYYTLVAWHAEPQPLPALDLTFQPDTGEPPRAITLDLPALDVRSVLPADADAEQLELRDPRPFLRIRPALWPWLLAAALLALAAFLWWRYRSRSEAREASRSLTAAEQALAGFAALRERWSAGELTAAGFFDGLESILGRYVRSTRSFAAGRPLRQLGRSDLGLAQALLRSTLARFARVGANGTGPLGALGSVERWVLSDGKLEDPAADGSPAEHEAEGPGPEEVRPRGGGPGEVEPADAAADGVESTS